ncbi:hypothetical protein CRENBAI_012080 [Crenichthys baileyi]|uniref:Uncharacterized protein n=1 Tax=Crenichthys baileyi TaxID=28760 RepID=A0AAV9SQH5_9TELE
MAHEGVPTISLPYSHPPDIDVAALDNGIVAISKGRGWILRRTRSMWAGSTGSEQLWIGTVLPHRCKGWRGKYPLQSIISHDSLRVESDWSSRGSHGGPQRERL